MSDNFERFKKCVVTALAVEPEQVTKEAKFSEDLGAESLELVELMMELEEEFDITVEEEELDDIESVGQALALVDSKV